MKNLVKEDLGSEYSETEEEDYQVMLPKHGRNGPMSGEEMKQLIAF